jgi:hypothetical protein
MNRWKTATFASLVALGITIGVAAAGGGDERQPLMHKALSSLREAKVALQTATHDKGGHRVKALEHVNAAIDQVQKGIAYDDSHRERPGRR